jgi:hypothetical protein
MVFGFGKKKKELRGRALELRIKYLERQKRLRELEKDLKPKRESLEKLMKYGKSEIKSFLNKPVGKVAPVSGQADYFKRMRKQLEELL